MLVYRLERPMQIGAVLRMIGPWIAACYDPSLEAVTWRYKRKLPGSCPEPKEDGILGFVDNSDHVCGWYDREGIYNWCRWEDDTEALEEVGFKINQYEVPDDRILFGKTQCVWSELDATLIKSVSWQEMVDAITSKEESYSE